MGAWRQHQHFIFFALDADFSIFNPALVAEHVLVNIIKINMEAQQPVRHIIKIILNGLADFILDLRGIICPDGVHGIEDCHLRHMVTAGKHIPHPCQVIIEEPILLPPCKLAEHGRRPVPLALALYGIMEPVGNKLVDPQHILPVRNPFHALHGAVPIRAAHGLGYQTDAAVLMRCRAGNFQRHMLVLHFPCADSRIQMIHAGHIKVAQMLKEVAVHPCMQAQGFLIEQMP